MHFEQCCPLSMDCSLIKFLHSAEFFSPPGCLPIKYKRKKAFPIVKVFPLFHVSGKCFQTEKRLLHVLLNKIHFNLRCFVGKRHLEEAMKVFSDQLSFEVTWKPFFLNRTTPESGIPLEQYLSQKYGPEAAATAKQGTGHLSMAGANVVK